MLYSDFLNFYLKSFLCSGIPSRYHTAFGCHVSRASFWLWQFLGLYCQVFCRTSFGWDLSRTFLTFVGLWKEDHTGKNAIFIPSYQGYRPSTWPIAGCRRWLSGWGTVRLLREVTVTPSPALSSSEGSRGARPALRVGVVLLPWGVTVYRDYPEPPAQEVCLFSLYSLNRLLTWLWA